jgi:hypothetical protein
MEKLQLAKAKLIQISIFKLKIKYIEMSSVVETP